MNNQEAQKLCDYIDASPSAFHAVEQAEAMLKAKGAQRLDEGQAWKLDPGSSYYVVRDSASLIAFRMGTLPPHESGFALSGAHSDFPGLRARLEKAVSAKGFERVTR